MAKGDWDNKCTWVDHTAEDHVPVICALCRKQVGWKCPLDNIAWYVLHSEGHDHIIRR